MPAHSRPRRCRQQKRFSSDRDRRGNYGLPRGLETARKMELPVAGFIDVEGGGVVNVGRRAVKTHATGNVVVFDGNKAGRLPCGLWRYSERHPESASMPLLLSTASRDDSVPWPVRPICSRFTNLERGRVCHSDSRLRNVALRHRRSRDRRWERPRREVKPATLKYERRLSTSPTGAVTHLGMTSRSGVGDLPGLTSEIHSSAADGAGGGKMRPSENRRQTLFCG